jgi:hypothetical protein
VNYSYRRPNSQGQIRDFLYQNIDFLDQVMLNTLLLLAVLDLQKDSMGTMPSNIQQPHS